MIPQTFHREALAWPEREAAGAELLAASAQLEAANALWHRRWQDQPSASELLRGHIESRQSLFRTRLEHRLSATWMALRPIGYDHEHSASCVNPNRQFLFESHFDQQRRTGMSFSGALCSSGSILLDRPLTVRSGEIGLCRGVDGVTVMFGPASDVDTRLASLGNSIANSDWPAATTAALAMAILLNIHPFDDGNGRVARALFQYIARDTGLAGRWPPLPWRALITASCGGFDLSLREVEILGRWVPFVDHLKCILALLAEVPRSTRDIVQREEA